jgi:hypothetical protein
LFAGCDSEPLCQPEKGIHNYPNRWQPCNDKLFHEGSDAWRYEWRACWPCGKRQIRKIEVIEANVVLSDDKQPQKEV